MFKEEKTKETEFLLPKRQATSYIGFDGIPVSPDVHVNFSMLDEKSMTKLQEKDLFRQFLEIVLARRKAKTISNVFGQEIPIEEIVTW